MVSIHKHFCIKINEFGVKGESGGLDLCHFPARKAVWVQKCGFWSKFHRFFCSLIDLGSNHNHQSKKKGGENLPCGPVCWAKMVHFWKPWKHASRPPPECQEPFSMLPRRALSSFMVWNAGVGPWWAATAEIFKGYGFKFHCLPTSFSKFQVQICSSKCRKEPQMAVKRSNFVSLINKNILYTCKTIQACFGQVRPWKPAKSSISEIANRTARTVRGFQNFQELY